MKVGTLKLLSDIMSHLATNMPHIAPFESSKGHGAPSDGCKMSVGRAMVVAGQWSMPAVAQRSRQCGSGILN